VERHRHDNSFHNPHRTNPSQANRTTPHTTPPRPHSQPTLLTTHPPKTVKDKSNHAVILEKATAERLNKEVTSYRLITVATLVDRMKINGSVARAALKDLEEKGVIRKVVSHARLAVYSMFFLSSSLSVPFQSCGGVLWGPICVCIGMGFC